jgi:hypothetical protein
MLAATVVVLSMVAPIFWHNHFISQRIDDFTGLSADAKERYFAQAFPSRQEIEGYLSDVTIVTSDPPIGNDVTYFDKQKGFFDWHGGEIVRGSWYLAWQLLRRTYRGQSKFGVAYLFCRVLDDGSFTDDNCILVGDKTQVRSFRSGAHEYSKGDLFGLSRRQSAPSILPDTPISIMKLKGMTGR